MTELSTLAGVGAFLLFHSEPPQFIGHPRRYDEIPQTMAYVQIMIHFHEIIGVGTRIDCRVEHSLDDEHSATNLSHSSALQVCYS